MTALLVAVGLLGAAGFVGARQAELVWLAVALKPLPVLAMAAHQLRARGENHPGLVALGLVLSGLGDVLLEWPGDLFVPGLVAFLCAHVCYIAAFTARAPRLAPLRTLPFAAYGAGMFALLLPHLGPMAVPVAAYCVVICTMAWRAAATVGVLPPIASLLAVAGAITFVASDSVIALDRFYGEVPGAPWLIGATYWLGQLGIALSTTTED